MDCRVALAHDDDDDNTQPEREPMYVSYLQSGIRG